MQTYMGLVRNPADATLIFEACRQGKLPRIQRRLSDRERNAIRSGSIFVWDEKEAGMRRWTDGKSWSASRVAGSFLTYREMEGKRAVGEVSSHQRGTGQSGDDSDENHDANDNQKYEMTESYKYKVDGLIKQSFSITTSEDQKLHLISYYGRSHPNNIHLRPPTQDPALMHISIPRGLYPESTLELSLPPGQGGSRPDDHHYSGPPPASQSGPPHIPGLPMTYGSTPQRIPPPPNNYPTHHPTSSHPYPDSPWDPRNGHQQSRPREIRPAVYESHREQPSHDQVAPGGPQYPHHPAANPQPHTPLSHHPPHNHHTHGQLFHPYSHPQSHTGSEKPHSHEYPPQHFRQGSNVLPPFSGHTPTQHQDPVRAPPSIPPQSLGSSDPQSHPRARRESFGRRTSLPRMNEQPRRTSGPQYSAPQPAIVASKVSPYDAAANAAGQHISLPDLHSVLGNDGERPVARDIPTDRLGRWQEETRVLDVLRNSMKL